MMLELPFKEDLLKGRPGLSVRASRDESPFEARVEFSHGLIRQTDQTALGKGHRGQPAEEAEGPGCRSPFEEGLLKSKPV
jgi:hypothetical protein